MKIQSLINESPLPDNWDHNIYNDKISFKKRIEYAKLMAQKVGSGSSRMVFKIPYQGRDTVLKIAKNSRGAAQNEHEAEMFSDWYLKNLQITIPMIDYDEKSSYPTWIHTEFAQKAKDSDFVKQFGGTLKDLMAFLSTKLYKNQISKVHAMHGDHNKISEDNENVSNLMDFMYNYNHIPANDYARLANWGLYKGKLVIIDLGLSSEIFNKFYKNTL